VATSSCWGYFKCTRCGEAYLQTREDQEFCDACCEVLSEAIALSPDEARMLQ
jgi:hypothetical protein